MFRQLVERAHRVVESLTITSPSVPMGGNFDVATYLTFFNELLQRLDGVAVEFESVIDEASRNLLAVAVERIFSNLRRHSPIVDLEVVTALVEDELTLPLSRALSAAVNAYADRFKQPKAKEASSEEEGEEDDEDDEDSGADDSA